MEPAKVFWQKLAEVLKKQASTIVRVFPREVNVMLPFVERVAEDVISEYVTPVLDEAHERDGENYLKAVTGLLKQSLDFGVSLQPALCKVSADGSAKEVLNVLMRVFDAHVDLYLQEELDFCKKRFSEEVDTWGKIIREQDEATESFFMSNVNREAEKRDFLTTFKKVILAPVSVIPSAFANVRPISAISTIDSKSISDTPYATDQDWNANNNRSSVMSNSSEDYFTNKNRTLSVASGLSGRASPAPTVMVAPTSELAAKAAIMNTKLQGISGLFSLDVALKLVHMAKESLERAAVFAKIGGQTGEEA